MKKILMSLLLLVVLLTSIYSVLGLSYMPDMFLSDQHKYSLQMDGEGEAIVFFKDIMYDVNKDINSYILEIPYKEIRLIGVYEKVVDSDNSNCLSWGNTCKQYGEGSTCVQYDYYGKCQTYEKPCLKYEQNCERFNQDISYTYEKIETQPELLSDKTILKINFKEPVMKGNQKEFIVITKIYDVGKSSLGKMNAEFETFKTNKDISSIRVSINVPDEFILKGKSSNTNYRSDMVTFAGNLESSNSLNSELSSKMSDISTHLEYSGGFVQTASYLDPYESLSVNVQYSKSWFALYWSNLFWSLLGVAIVIFLISYGIKKLKEYTKENLPIKQQQKDSETKHKFIIPFLGGLFSALGIALLWGLIYVILLVLDNILGYRYNDLLILLMILLGILLTLFGMIGIPIFTGHKFGATTGFFTTLSLFVWLIVFAIIFVVISAIL
ncbi:hypothetical protein K9L67_00035 [Candidatus Woesearchaeota archaeon]|nr:hypothetical protein [Candidatus Woesearchaeota archaeon]MCF7900595.1 hypothetical protein [Candidatus Woesearchaeota archaeon]MCF8013411.1 hypothetical protein [Candidatus Woesearchaeota archaeon]